MPTTIVKGRKVIRVKVPQKTTKITKTVRPAKLKDQTRVAMMNVVNKILNRKSETKYITNYRDDTQHIWTQFNSQIYGPGQFGSAVPAMVQGTTDYTRLGDSVSPVKMYTDLRFRVKPVDPLTTNGNPVDITVVIYYGVCKKLKSVLDVAADASLPNTLLKLGYTSAVSGLETKPFMGYAEDTDYVINDDIWTLKKKTVRLYKTFGSINGPASPGVPSAPNRNEAHVRLNFTKTLPAKLRYDDAAGQFPVNYAPVYAVGYYYNDSTPPDTGAGIVEAIALEHLWYKDM